MSGLVIYRPVVSEKSVYLGSVSKYTFLVDPRANAATVKSAVEALFQVKVKTINIINTKGKPKSFGRMKVKRAAGKKAVVTLEPGHTIKLFEETAKDAH